MTTQGKKSAERTARIIELARKDSTLTNSAIAQRLGIDASTVSATLKKAGVIAASAKDGLSSLMRPGRSHRRES